MNKFIQLHILTSYPPSNLNRDDMGRPKTARMGGVDRLRISSQSLKRSWRTSELFKESFNDSIGERTKIFGVELFKYFISKKVVFENALKWTKIMVGEFGDLEASVDLSKIKDDKKRKELLDKLKEKWRKWDKDGLKIEDYSLEQLNELTSIEWSQLVFVDHEEKNKIYKIADQLIDGTICEIKGELLNRTMTSVDVALFGRMLATNPGYNVEAACQVSHSISVHPVVIEDDYFTAVDDLNNGSDSQGAAHIGESGFASALFYTYICIDKELLTKNLGTNIELANKTIGALVETAVKVAPEGKQNSFGSRSWASYVLAEKGDDQPRSLSVAFLKPIIGSNYGEDAINALKKTCANIDKVYELNAPHRKEFNALTGEGTISELINFVKE